MALTVVQLSDTHLLSDPSETWKGQVNPEVNLTTALRQAMKLQPDLVLLTGDLAHETDARPYQRIASLLNNLEVESAFIAGNHDLPSSISALCGPRIITDTVFRRGHWQFIMLDSTIEGEVAGRLSEDDQAAVSACLEGCQMPTLVATHHPIHIVGSSWLDGYGMQNGQAVCELLTGHACVKLAISGHVHQATSVRLDGLVSLSCPSTCYQFAPKCDTPSYQYNTRPGYRVLTLHSNGNFETNVVRFDVESR